jgi:hypothetical protein
MRDVNLFQMRPDFRPRPGLMNNQHNPPINAMQAAKPRSTGQPYVSAIQGVSVGERVPPKLAPVFIRPGDF